MKFIENGKLYDTEKSEFLCNFRNFGEIWRTENGTLFVISSTGWEDQENRQIMIFSTDQEYIKEELGKADAEKYIELFGEVEEA